MSWEVMRSETAPCECCAGTVTYTFEMDDWNRTRNGREIHCGTCQEKDRLRVEAEHARQIKRDSLLEEARRIATERYLELWLKSYASLSKGIPRWVRSIPMSDIRAACRNTLNPVSAMSLKQFSKSWKFAMPM